MSANKMLLVVVLLRIALVVLDKAFANVELVCPRLAVPLGTRTTFYCSSNGSSGLDIGLAGSPDVAIYGSVGEGYNTTRGLLTVIVVKKTSTILTVAISFSVSLPLLNTYLTCTSITNEEYYDTCLLSYPRPRLDPHAAVLCEERSEVGCSLRSLSWNCSKNQLPLKEVEVFLDGDVKANVSQDTCTHYFRDNGTRPSSNLTLVGHYVTNDSSTVTALIDLHSPFQISRNKSDHGNITMYVFDVVEEQKPSGLLELYVVQSNNITIRKEDTPPLIIEVSGNVNISYTLRTVLINGGFSVLYEQNGTQRFVFNSNGNTTTSGASALEHCLFLIFICTIINIFHFDLVYVSL